VFLFSKVINWRFLRSNFLHELMHNPVGEWVHYEREVMRLRSRVIVMIVMMWWLYYDDWKGSSGSKKAFPEVKRTNLNCDDCDLTEVMWSYFCVCLGPVKLTIPGGSQFMCGFVIAENPTKHSTRLLRGAVFFVAMSTWGSQRISELNYPFSSILPYFKKVLSCKYVWLFWHETDQSWKRRRDQVDKKETPEEIRNVRRERGEGKETRDAARRKEKLLSVQNLVRSSCLFHQTGELNCPFLPFSAFPCVLVLKLTDRHNRRYRTASNY
jgi:hypothetical protein